MDAILIGTAGFAVYIALMLPALRMSGRSPAVVVVLGACVGYAALIAGGTLLRPPLPFWDTSAVYAFLTLCFLMIFGAAYKSISLRILLDLLGREDRADSYRTIQQRYVQQESYRDRLKILESGGFAVRHAAGFRLTVKGRRLAAVVSALQRTFRIERSG